MPNEQERDEEFVGVVLMRWVVLSALLWWAGWELIGWLMRLIWPAS